MLAITPTRWITRSLVTTNWVFDHLAYRIPNQARQNSTSSPANSLTTLTSIFRAMMPTMIEPSTASVGCAM